MLTDFNSLSGESRIWIYQGNRPLSNKEVGEALVKLEAFLNQWAAHGNQLHASGKVFYNRFLIVATDQLFHMASGCSIDSSVRFIQELGEQLDVDFFRRTDLAFLKKGEVEVYSLGQLKSKIESGDITTEDLFFDNTIAKKSQLEKEWIVKAGESWLNRYFKAAESV